MYSIIIKKKARKFLDKLPQSEQNLAYEFIKRLVLAWDPDFTKLTPSERKSLEEAEADGEYFELYSIDWDN